GGRGSFSGGIARNREGAEGDSRTRRRRGDDRRAGRCRTSCASGTCRLRGRSRRMPRRDSVRLAIPVDRPRWQLQVVLHSRSEPLLVMIVSGFLVPLRALIVAALGAGIAWGWYAGYQWASFIAPL